MYVWHLERNVAECLAEFLSRGENNRDLPCSTERAELNLKENALALLTEWLRELYTVFDRRLVLHLGEIFLQESKLRRCL